MASRTITVILAVSLSVAAKAQYQLPPTVEQQEYSYSQDGSYYQPQTQYQYHQPQRLTQSFGNGARSSSSFSFGQRKVAVQVNHHDANQHQVPSWSHHGVPGYQFGSSPAERAVNQFPQNYQFQNSLPSQNAFASSNPQQNADYNAQQNVVQNAYTISNPINGEKYSLNQPSWGQSAYDVNINYKNQETPQTFTTASPPLHNFQFHNNFVPQTNIFSQFGQRAPTQGSFVFNNRPVYRNPTLTNFQNALNQDPGYNLQAPQQYPNYEVSVPNQSDNRQKSVYTQPSTDGIQFRFSSAGVENEVSHEGNAVQALPEVPSFESGKVTTKQEIIKNTTVITLTDEEIRQEGGTTSTPLTTSVDLNLPVVEDTKVRSGPYPTIVQPTAPKYESQSEHYNNLVKLPDYSNLYRSQATPTTQPPQAVPHNFNLYFQQTPGLETSTRVAPVDQRLQQPGDYYFQTTQKPQQQSEYVFYQSTPAAPSNSYQDYQLLPGHINNGLSSNGNLQGFNPVEDKNQMKETLFSVNGFVEDLPDTTTEKVPQQNGISIEQSFTGNYEETKVTEGNTVSEIQTTTELPLTTTVVNPSPYVLYGTTAYDNLSNRNGVQYPTTQPSDNNRRVSSTTSGANIEDFLSPFSPVQHTNTPDSEGSKSTETNEESVTNQNLYYNFVSSSTPPVTTVTDQDLVTEVTLPVVSDSPADSQSVVSRSRGYDREAAIRRKKIRVYKKPTIDEGLPEQQQSLDRERVSKQRNEYRGRRIRPNNQNLVTTSLPETTQKTIPRGRYHASIPQRGRVTFHRTTTQSVVDETPSQPTIAPEHNQEPVSQPISSTVSHHRQQSRFPQTEPISTTSEFESDRAFQTSTVSQNRIPQLRYQNRQRIRPTVPQYRHETTTTIQEPTTPITDDIKTTEFIQFTSRIESSTKHETIEFEQTNPTESAIDITEPTKEPEQVFTSQRTRLRAPYQRGPGDDRPLRKHDRPVFSLKKHNFNGRLKVNNPVPVDGQEEQPEERKQVRYHAVKYSPQRQMVIRRIKVKSNHRSESSETDDQDASGTIRTSYRRNQAIQDSLDKKLQSTIVKNSVRFPPRKPLSRFSITTAKEEIQESSSESTINRQTSPMTSSENQGSIGTTITVQDTEHVTTERFEIHQESTTTKVTEKRQTSDDPDLRDLVENTQSLQEEDKYDQDQGEESLIRPNEQSLQFENEPYENPSETYTAEQHEDDWEDENPEGVIIHSLPEESDPSMHPGIIDDPIETDVVPSISPSQNPSEIVTRIDVVTSISEENGQNRRVEDISEISTSEELVQ